MRRSHHAGKAAVRIDQAVVCAIEALEQRRLLSSSVTSTLIDNGDGTNTLKVTGTKNKDYITVIDDPANNVIQVFNDKNHNGNEDSGEVTPFDSTDLNAVLIDSQQGDDTVKYDVVSDYDDAQRSIEVDLSDGNDNFTFESINQDSEISSDFVAQPVYGILDHSSINVEVDGQEKNDTIEIDLYDFSIEKSSVLFNVDAGSGNDTVSFQVPFLGDIGSDAPGNESSGGPSDYTQLQVQVDLGSGNNLFSDYFLAFISYAQVSINVNGGSGKDTIESTEGYELVDDSGFSYTANLEGGNDWYNGDFTGNDIEDGSEANYNLQGGDGNDRMTFEGTGEEAGSGVALPDSTDDEGIFDVGGIFQVNMYGGTGNDTMDMWNDENFGAAAKPAAKPQATPNSSSDAMKPLLIGTSEDGDVRVVMSGDAGNDKVLMNLGATEDSVGDYDLSVLGASGKDTVAAGFADDTAAPNSDVTFGPSGAILLDGGRDTDTYQVVSYEDVSTDPPTALTPFDIRAVEILSSSLLPPLI